ncbi:hypothetical protein LWC34_34580 [Kibdelosporangium philippinense]|uniref:Uncharacterized protein n=1 Tax=Kibdelosporangium philippinense TaxID=211113 RepID=A0ABS8ZJG6_9PSEU|nr:hypothetical protein [Kibdelosporangium philippinense]MCE7007911.1 hypothetical protein [Kibdelosporangium philippinense]
MTTVEQAGTGELWASVPEQFTPIDLAEDFETRVLRTIRQAEYALPGSTPEQRMHLALAQEAMIGKMLEQGVRYAATCVAKTEDERPSLTMANLTVTFQAAELTGLDPLGAIANGLKTKNPKAKQEIGYLNLPVGRTLAIADEVKFTPPTSAFGVPSDREHVVRQASAVIPHPHGTRIVIIGMSTEFLTEWTLYTEMFRAILETVSFEPPRKPSSIASRLGGF